MTIGSRADLTRRRLSRRLEIDAEIRDLTKRLRRALTDTEGRAYCRRKLAEGKTEREACAA